MRKANKDMKKTELSGVMAKAWKGLGEEERKVGDENVCCGLQARIRVM